jgi:Asp-tRNA(Asn)/Glu-tRNA(Gln) amidotransferase A subunit family amidase
MEPYRLTATQALSKIKAGSLTIEQYARSLLSRIESRDATVQAWAHLDPEYVIREARRLDQVPFQERGPLHGLPIAVKDIIYTKGTFRKQYYRQENTSLSRKGRYADAA